MTELKEFLSRRHVTHNLERFFEDLYHQELEIKIEKTEVKFIKRGIENLVQTIAHLLVANGNDEIENIKHDYEEAFPGLVIHDDEGEEEIIKVGSIYDKTKNAYPDEFDFILSLFTFYCECDAKFGYVKFGYTYAHEFKFLHRVLETLLLNESNAEHFVYSVPEDRDKEIRFVKYVGLFGSSSKLRFLYRNGNTSVFINVDIVLAVKRLDQLIQYRHLSTQSEFNEELAQTGSVLYVNEKPTFTETEVTFVKHVLSAKHRKVYRILKYLINGNGDGDVLDEVIRRSGLFYERISSHMIKTEIILHHYRCGHKEKEVSPCVMEILDSFKYYDSNNSIPSLAHTSHTPHFFRSVDKQKALEDMFETLNAMKTTMKPYHFDKHQIIPIAASLLIYPKNVYQVIYDSKASDCICSAGSYCLIILQALFAIAMFSIFLTAWIHFL